MTYLCGRCVSGRTDIDHGRHCPKREKHVDLSQPFLVNLCTERDGDGGCDEHETHLVDEATGNWFYDMDAHSRSLAVTRNPNNTSAAEQKPNIPSCPYDCSYIRNADQSITILYKGDRCTIEEHQPWEVVPYAG